MKMAFLELFKIDEIICLLFKYRTIYNIHFGLILIRKLILYIKIDRIYQMNKLNLLFLINLIIYL